MAALAFSAMIQGLFRVVGFGWIGLDWIGLDVRVLWVLMYIGYLRHSRDIAKVVRRFNPR